MISKLRKLTKDEVKIEVTRLEEDTDPKLLGYDPIVAEGISRLAERSPWGWCVVKVTAKWRDYEGTVYLGGCSYESEEDFRTDSEQYHDLVNEAVEVLNLEIAQGVAKALEILKELRITTN